MTFFNFEHYNKEDPTDEIIKTFNNYIENDNSKLFKASKLLKKEEKDEFFRFQRRIFLRENRRSVVGDGEMAFQRAFCSVWQLSIFQIKRDLRHVP